MSDSTHIGFIGAGKMATALAKGFAKAGLVQPENLIASDPIAQARQTFGEALGCPVIDSNAEVVSKAGVVFLAVKPGQLEAATAGIRDQFNGDHLVVSIMAGVKLASLDEAVGRKARVVRVMPNTPALVGASASAYALGASATPADGELVHRLFSSVGVAFEVKESLLDAVTGLSGSGPAYVYLMIEAMSDGAVAAGLPRDIATTLAAQTLLGGAKMTLETGLHPGALKDMVTSPGGTTIEGLHELEAGGLRAALMNAVRAAAQRSVELGRN